MNNTALSALITEYGDQIQAIILDNVSKIYIGYKFSSCKSISDVELVTIGGEDFIRVPKDSSNPKYQAAGVQFKMLHPTDTIQGFLINTDPESKILYDPLELG